MRWFSWGENRNGRGTSWSRKNAKIVKRLNGNGGAALVFQAPWGFTLVRVAVSNLGGLYCWVCSIRKNTNCLTLATDAGWSGWGGSSSIDLVLRPMVSRAARRRFGDGPTSVTNDAPTDGDGGSPCGPARITGRSGIGRYDLSCDSRRSANWVFFRNRPRIGTGSKPRFAEPDGR